ncbi:hypothetical protein IM977_004017 [Salmonella enterica subsp. enterica serovar Typhimurium]|nr:hypothetical protein [Salmonella enterica subsp. enterica serovar Typhimurium]
MMNIPLRNKNIVAVPRPTVRERHAPFVQVNNAFNRGPYRYEKTMKKLSEV